MTLAKEKGLKVTQRHIRLEELADMSEGAACGTACVISPMDKVIDPEREGGVRSARILASSQIHEYIEIGNNLCIVELEPKSSWVNHNLIELDLRKKHNINVAAIRLEDGNWGYLDPTRKLKAEDLLMVMIAKSTIDKWK
jgi:trk system potassium uptake protein TrkA